MLTQSEPTAKIHLGDPSRYFVPRGKLTDALFQRGGTPTGEYRRLKGAVVFYEPSGAPRVALIDNAHGERFYVSCRRPSPGKPIFYLFGLNNLDAEWAGIPAGHAASRDSAARVAESV